MVYFEKFKEVAGRLELFKVSRVDPDEVVEDLDYLQFHFEGVSRLLCNQDDEFDQLCLFVRREINLLKIAFL